VPRQRGTGQARGGKGDKATGLSDDKGKAVGQAGLEIHSDCREGQQLQANYTQSRGGRQAEGHSLSFY